MAKTQLIRRRLKSVKNIHQITKAMEMVAASKLRKVQEAALKSRLYVSTAREALQTLSGISSLADHPLFKTRPVNKELLIAFTSDRGLAGAYNSNVLKKLVATIKDSPADWHYLILIGTRGAQFISRLKGKFEVIGAYTGWPVEPKISEVAPIITTAINMFMTQQIDSVRFISTDFISLAKQQVTTHQLLPSGVPRRLARHSLGDGGPRPTESEILIEPSKQALIDYLLPRLFEVQLFQAALEASASEQSMRMVAMKNASDNASDLTDDLTLLFNSARQAAITQELAEISAGAAATS